MRSASVGTRRARISGGSAGSVTLTNGELDADAFVGKANDFRVETIGTNVVVKDLKQPLRSDAPAAAVQEMERLMRLHDDVMRVLTVKVDKHEDGPSVQMQKRDERDSRDGPRGDRGDRPPRDRDDRPRDRDGDRGGFRGDRR